MAGKMKNLTKKRPISTAKAKKYKAKFLINKPIGGKHPGMIVDLDISKEGTPLLKYWRRRLHDAKLDGCMELVPNKPKIKDKPKSEGNA